jgi:putative thiamine transport system ATP-binding protein
MTLEIHIRRLSAGGKLLVQDLTLRAESGQIVTLMGASGSGKSTVLAAICGLASEAVKFDGDVLLNSQSLKHLPTAQRRIGMLFQDDLLFAHMTVRQNLLFAVPAGARKDRHATVQATLDHLGFADMADRSPGTLSGGQRARVSLMRTLLAQPHALLLDEPFSKLDTALRQQFRDFVFQHVQEHNLPTLLVTHDIADVANCNAVIRL